MSGLLAAAPVLGVSRTLAGAVAHLAVARISAAIPRYGIPLAGRVTATRDREETWRHPCPPALRS